MSAHPIACEFCGFLNPPGTVLCEGCGLQVTASLLGRGTMRSRSTEQFSRMVGSIRPVDRTPGIPFRWLEVSAVVVVTAILLTGYVLNTQGLLGRTTPAAPRFDLCAPSTGTNCKGTVLTLPSTAFGRPLNVTGCDSIVPNGTGEQLVVQYVTSTSMYGVLIPSTLYWGTNVSYFPDPVGFFNDSWALEQAAWNSGLVEGSHTVDAAVPTSHPEWCLTWWDPGMAGTITFNADAYLTS